MKIKILYFVMGLLFIFLSLCQLENIGLQKEIDSIEKALAHREKMARIWADRYDFLRYQLSATNIRVSILENESQYISSDEIRLMYRDIQEGT